MVVLKLIRINHQFKLLHHLIPESVTSGMHAFETHVFLLWLSESSPQGLLSERLDYSCGASWNWMCNIAKLCVNALFRTSPQNLNEGIPASGMYNREGEVCHHSFVTCLVLKDGGLHWGGSCWCNRKMWNTAAQFWCLRCPGSAEFYHRLLTHCHSL